MLKHRHHLLRPFFGSLGVVAAEGSPAADPVAEPAAAAPAAPAPVATSLRAIVAASLAAVKGGRAPAAALAALTAERDAALARATAAEADLASAQASLKSTGTHLSTVCSLLGLETKDITGLEAAAVSALFHDRLQAAVSEGLAGLGFPAAQLPAASASATGSAESIEELRASLNAETDPEKRGELVVKLRAAQAAAKKSRTV